MNVNSKIFAKADSIGTVGLAPMTPMELTESQWMMDSKYGSVNISLSTSPTCCGLFNNELDFINDILDNDMETEPVSSGINTLQCEVEESFLEQLSSSSPDSCSIDNSFSSTAAVSPSNYTVSSSTENFDLVASSTLVGECNTTSDVDILSMLLGDNEDPLEDILGQIESTALRQSQSAEVVQLDHDYIKKNATDVIQLCSENDVCEKREYEFIEPPIPKKRKFAEVEKRTRNNEASRRSRVIRKEKFKKMETDVQRLAADNQRMRVLLKDMESVAKRCKEQLVSSLGRNG